MQNQAWSTNWDSAIDQSIAIDLLATPALEDKLTSNFWNPWGISVDIWRKEKRANRIPDSALIFAHNSIAQYSFLEVMRVFF